MRTDINRVHVIFKTHLDVGFTDYAHKVVDRYMSQFIPDAIALSETMQRDHPTEPFCWTVGSWLMHEYLKRSSPSEVTRMEAAIADERVVWHGLPFTTHTELMDETLFRHALSLSQQLDERYGKKTIAAKMTDVPGHTRTMIPLLAEAGIRFFHVGVNPAATVPDVPPVFVWHDKASDTRLTVMYQQVYGDVMILPGTNEAVALVFTGDNLGPPTQKSIHRTYANLRERFPKATFIGSNLNLVAQRMLDAAMDLPVVTSEIGDTWIHGIGTDPTKVSQYRALLRLRDEWLYNREVNEAQLSNFHDALMMIPEHTWGMDLKTHLRDYENYTTDALAKARQTSVFQTFEASWAEQRAYITQAVDALGEEKRAEAQQCLLDIEPREPELSRYITVKNGRLESDVWTLGIDTDTGAIHHLLHKPTGRTLTDDQHLLGLLTYETFSTADYERYWTQYIRDREHGDVRVWAHPDNIKPGLEVLLHQSWIPSVQSLYIHPNTSELVAVLAFPDESRKIGAPATVYLQYEVAQDDAVRISMQWFGKPACRLPEAFWMTFRPAMKPESHCYITKLGMPIDPDDVISRGARTLHGVNGSIGYSDTDLRLEIASLDVSLVAPGRRSLLDFHNELPNIADGVHFNCYNNVWGTNFPMWYEDNAQFRFIITVEDEHKAQSEFSQNAVIRQNIPSETNAVSSKFWYFKWESLRIRDRLARPGWRQISRNQVQRALLGSKFRSFWSQNKARSSKKPRL